MATRKILYKHIAQSASTYIGRAGELILDTVNKTIRLTDGSTAGGNPVEVYPGKAGAYTTTLAASGSDSGDADDVSITDNSQTEIITFTNHLTNTAVRATIPVVTSLGKIVGLQCVSGSSNVLVGYTVNGAWADVTLGASTRKTLMWMGDNWLLMQ